MADLNSGLCSDLAVNTDVLRGYVQDKSSMVQQRKSVLGLVGLIFNPVKYFTGKTGLVYQHKTFKSKTGSEKWTKYDKS